MQIQSTTNQSFAYRSPSSTTRLKSSAKLEEPSTSTDKSSNEKTSETSGNSDKKKAQSADAIQAELSLQERQSLQDLKVRDRQVRAHEAAHLAASGPYAKGGASYSYQKGPDGKQYAVGGEVSIDTSPVANDPAATMRKARTIRRAANAPSNPSAQDRRVASQAGSMEVQARQDLATLKAEENKPVEKKSIGIGETSFASEVSGQEETDKVGEKPKQTYAVKSVQEQSLINPLDYVGGLLDLVA